MDGTPKPHSVNLQFDVDRDTFIEEAVCAMSSVNSESASSIMASLAKDHFLRRVDSREWGGVRAPLRVAAKRFFTRRCGEQPQRFCLRG